MVTPHLKKFLNTLSNEELIKHLLELDKKFKPVQEYYQLYLHNDVEALLNKYKKQIENEFFPALGVPKMRLSVARKAVNEAKKLEMPVESMIDLMLFYVETGVRFTCDYGDIDEPFYNSMESMYGKVLEYMKKEGLLAYFQSRAQEIVEKSSDIGWGFCDTLADYYYEYYQE
jgi:hypothetical protein